MICRAGGSAKLDFIWSNAYRVKITMDSGKVCQEELQELSDRERSH